MTGLLADKVRVRVAAESRDDWALRLDTLLVGATGDADAEGSYQGPALKLREPNLLLPGDVVLVARHPRKTPRSRPIRPREVRLEVVLPDGALATYETSTAAKQWPRKLYPTAQHLLALGRHDRLRQAVRQHVVQLDILYQGLLSRLAAVPDGDDVQRDRLDLDLQRVGARLATFRGWQEQLAADSNPRADAIARIHALMNQHGLTKEDL